MALKTQGFALSALPTAPKIPGNVGIVDVNAIYDGVKKGLESFEAVRRAPQGMALADAQMQAATEQAPLATRGVLAETQAKEQQLPIKTGILAQQEDSLKKAAPYKQAILEAQASPEFLDAKLKQMLQQHVPAGAREFDLLTANLTPDQKERARLIHLGMEGRASGAAIKYEKFTGADGREYFMAVDPNRVGTQVIGSGQTYGSGVVRPGDVALPKVGATEAQGAVVAPTEVDELGNPVGAAAAPQNIAPTPQPTTNIFQSPTLQEKKAQEATGTKGVEIQMEARAKLPKALTGLESLESKTKRVESDIDEAIKLAKGTTTGFGAILKNVPATEARKLDSLLTSIRANVGFDALTDMRVNSPTGGALGNVSDYEGKTLQATISALDQALEKGDLKEALLKVKEARREALTRTRNAYERDVDMFGVKSDGAPASAPVAPAETPGWTDAKETRLQELKSKLGK